MIAVYSFVILHYKSYIDTIECVNSILELDYKKVSIVIVDNASKDGSLNKIIEEFGGNKNIHIIENDRNLGFASGNNTGYIYAKEKLDAKFIFVCNNDLVFNQKRFISNVEKIYAKTKAHIIGPDIESLADGIHQSPMKGALMNFKEINKEIFRYKTLLFLSKIGVYDFLKNNKKSTTAIDVGDKKNIFQKNVVLHGAMLIFTPLYVEKEDQAFRSGTFLYMEEDILYTYAQWKKYTMVYTPQLHVYHKEDSSTNATFNSSKRKREFIFKNMIKSLKVYKGYLNRISG